MTNPLTLCILLLSATSCVPFAVPPLRAELGAGTLDEPPPAVDQSGESEAPDADGATGTVLARVGVHPLQLAPRLANRAVDLGVGYSIEGVQRSSVYREGPYAEAAVFPLRGGAGRGQRWRAGVLLVGDYSAAGTPGFADGAVLLASTAELTGFTKGTFATEDAAGIAYGEWGIGFFAGPSRRFGSEGTPWAFSGGLSARIPMTVGVACCIELDSSKDTDAGRGHRRSKRSRRSNGRRHRRG